MSDDTPPPAAPAEEVQHALSYFLGVSALYRVDEATGQVFRKSDGSALTLGTGENAKPVYVFGPNLPTADIWIVNPYSEGFGDRSQGSIFLYSALAHGLSLRMLEILLRVLNAGAEQKAAVEAAAKSKSKKKDEVVETYYPTQITELLAARTTQGKIVIDEIDDETYAEADKFLNLHLDVTKPFPLIAAQYRQRLLTAVVNCPFIDDEKFIAHQSGIRKKTLLVIQAIIRQILGCSTTADLDTLAVNATSVKHVPPRLYSILAVGFNIYQRLAPILDAVDSPNMVDLGEYRHYLENTAAYKMRAGYMSSPVTSVATVTRQSTPTGAPMRAGVVAPAPLQNTSIIGAVGMGGGLIGEQPQAYTTLPPIPNQDSASVAGNVVTLAGPSSSPAPTQTSGVVLPSARSNTSGGTAGPMQQQTIIGGGVQQQGVLGVTSMQGGLGSGLFGNGYSSQQGGLGASIFGGSSLIGGMPNLF